MLKRKQIFDTKRHYKRNIIEYFKIINKHDIINTIFCAKLYFRENVQKILNM